MVTPRELPETPLDEPLDRPTTDAPSLVALLRRLGDQAQSLVRQEVALAKAELRETVRDLAIAASALAAGALLILVSLTVFLVFFVLALGELLGGRYWLSALLVGLLFAVAGIALLLRAKRRLSSDGLVPAKTLASVQETARWATDEAQRFRRNGGSEPTRPALPEP